MTSTAPHSRPSTIRRDGRARMLAVVALAGAAALVTGCASQTPGEPPAPPPAIVGSDPIPLDDAQLNIPGLFEEVSDAGYALRWSVPGESIAVVIGGSGAGGECVSQPHAAALEPNAPSIVVRFEPPNPEAVCTADFALHGWELGLADAIDPGAVVPVRLVNRDGSEDVVDTHLGPDDTLVSLADPQPSAIPDSGTVPPPTPIPSEQLPEGVLADAASDPVQVWWIEPGRSLAVMLTAPSPSSCAPQPVGAAPTGPGSIEVTFEPAQSTTCNGDATVYGWHITLPAAVSSTLPVEVTVRGAVEGAPIAATLERSDVLDLP